MNSNSISQLSLLQARAEVVRRRGDDQPTHLAIAMAESSLVWGLPPPPSVETIDRFTAATERNADALARRFAQVDESLAVAAEALREPPSVALAIAKARADGRLSQSGKDERRVEAGAAAIGALAKLAERQAALSSTTTARLDALYRVPRLADAAAIANAREVRDHVRGLDLVEALRFAETAPYDAIAALQSSPIPLTPRLAETADRRWRALIESQQPSAAAEVQAAADNAAWSSSVIASALTMVLRLTSFTPTKAFEIARPSGDAALQVLGFNQQDTSQLSQRMPAEQGVA